MGINIEQRNARFTDATPYEGDGRDPNDAIEIDDSVEGDDSVEDDEGTQTLPSYTLKSAGPLLEQQKASRCQFSRTDNVFSRSDKDAAAIWKSMGQLQPHSHHSLQQYPLICKHSTVVNKFRVVIYYFFPILAGWSMSILH